MIAVARATLIEPVAAIVSRAWRDYVRERIAASGSMRGGRSRRSLVSQAPDLPNRHRAQGCGFTGACLLNEIGVWGVAG